MKTQSQQAQFRFIPVKQLSLSSLNVRKAAPTGIEQLADLIAAEGVLQNLDVYEPPQGERQKGTSHAVIAGGRRWRALQLLIKQKRIKSDFAVPCLIVSHERAIQISLAENCGREPMHPADEFDAFRSLFDAGQSIEDVAARFGVTPLVVQRRLKLANVSPNFIALYREGEITLEHLMAFAVTDDPARQQQAWDSLKAFERTPDGIRRVLTDREVSASDPIARFVGIKAYQKAGGIARRDLFDQEDEGSMLDGALLRQLAVAKLDKHALELKADGIAWVEVCPEFDYASRAAYGHVRMHSRAPTDEEDSQLKALRTRQAEIETQMEACEDDEDRQAAFSDEIEQLDERIDSLIAQREIPDPEQQASAGVVLSIGCDGKVRIDQGLLRPDDARRFTRGERSQAGAVIEKAPRVHSAALVRRLTAHRTLALQAELTQQPMKAAVILAHRLALHTFYYGEGSCRSPIKIHFPGTALKDHAADLEGSPAQLTLEAHHKALREKLPSEADELLPWLLEQSGADILSLLAYCTAVTADGVQSDEGPSDMDGLARAVGLDMRTWWTPNVASYLGSVSRAKILEAVKEAVSERAAVPLANLKKAPLAAAAEQQLAGSGWLPTILRNVA
jgi:ParB family chromosome partitioning protein